MSAGPQAQLLPDGKRLHLHHGPIDLIIGVDGPQRTACFEKATARFETVLQGLVVELDDLRRPLGGSPFHDPIARRMAQAVRPMQQVFVTPMAAVAGAVADEILHAMLSGEAPVKAYVNNGGDTAFHLAHGQQITSTSPAGNIVIRAQDTARGLATSGWRGRSHSLGIADTVTVAAPTAAAADVAATLIANAVDLPSHPGIQRTPACNLSPDSDLGKRPVTTHVPPLNHNDIARGLQSGASFARTLLARGLICQASLCLQGRTLTIGPEMPALKGTLAHA